MWLRLIVTVVCFFISTSGFAHSADHHVLGTIMAIDATHVEVKTPKGQSVEVQVNKKTRYKDGRNPKGTAVPEVGDRVVISATKDNKVLLATEIHFSSAKRVQAPTSETPVH